MVMGKPPRNRELTVIITQIISTSQDPSLYTNYTNKFTAFTVYKIYFNNISVWQAVYSI